MINTKELTTGCYVKVNGKPHRVDEIFNNAVGLEKWDTLFISSDLEPIPITKELLLKSGFVEESYDEFYDYIKEVDSHWIAFKRVSNTPNRDWYLHIVSCGRCTVGGCDIQYIHQVQTFCNVLGIDLKLKL